MLLAFLFSYRDHPTRCVFYSREFAHTFPTRVPLSRVIIITKRVTLQ